MSKHIIFKIRKTYSIIFLLIALLAQNTYSQNEMLDKKIIEIDQYLNQYISKRNLPGLSITIMQNDTILLSKGYGFIDIAKNIKATPNSTQFRIASLAKMFTAIQIANLIDSNKISLNTSIDTFFNDSSLKHITIRHLLSHSSGLPQMPKYEKYGCENEYNIEKFYNTFSSEDFTSKPDSLFSYSNYGYKILGIIIEKITSKNIIDHNQDLFNSLNMLHTTIDRNTNSDNFYHELINNKNILAQCLDCRFKYAEGCYLSTTEDLTKFGRAILKHQIISAYHLNLFTKSQVQNSLEGKKYGLGFELGESFVLQKKTSLQKKANILFSEYYGHRGNIPGGSAVLNIYPNQQLIIAITINRTDIPCNLISEKIFKILNT